MDMNRLLTAVVRLARRNNGQDLLEYALLAALIAVVAMAGVSTLGNTINNVFWQSIAQTF
jgi:pilus assembly protein Flp/PilA